MTCDRNSSLSNICLKQGQREREEGEQRKGGSGKKKKTKGERQLDGKEDKGGEMKLMSVRCARLTFSILQQKEDCVFRDNKLPQLHHVRHRVRHDCPLSPPTVTALPQTLR